MHSCVVEIRRSDFSFSSAQASPCTPTAENCRKESAEDGRHVWSAAHVVGVLVREYRMSACKNSCVDVVNMLPVMDINDKADDDRRGVKRKMALSRSVTVV